MTTLNEQIAELEEQLNWNQQADNFRHILKEYDAIRTPLLKADRSLRVMSDNYTVLLVLPQDAPARMVFSTEIKEAAQKVRFALETFTERWKQEMHEARQGNYLALVVQGLNALVSACDAEIVDCWQQWVDHLKIIVELEKILLQSQKGIPGLEETYKGFVEARTRFQELIEQFPQSVNTINELQQLSKTMHELKGQMQFDLPDEVADFFKKLDVLNRKVSLAVLTPEVFKWLRSNNLLGEYVVERRGRS